MTAFVFHTKFSDHNQLLHFEKDLALAGALLALFARGAGHYAVDSLRRKSMIPKSAKRFSEKIMLHR